MGDNPLGFLGGLLTGGGSSPLGAIGSALQLGPFGLAGKGLDALGAGDALGKLGLGGAADFLFGKHTLDPTAVGNTMGADAPTAANVPAATGARTGGLLANMGPAALAANAGAGGGPAGAAPAPAPPNAAQLQNFLASLRPQPRPYLGRGGGGGPVY